MSHPVPRVSTFRGQRPPSRLLGSLVQKCPPRRPWQIETLRNLFRWRPWGKHALESCVCCCSADVSLSVICQLPLLYSCLHTVIQPWTALGSQAWPCHPGKVEHLRLCWSLSAETGSDERRTGPVSAAHLRGLGVGAHQGCRRPPGTGSKLPVLQKRALACVLSLLLSLRALNGCAESFYSVSISFPWLRVNRSGTLVFLHPREVKGFPSVLE